MIITIDGPSGTGKTTVAKQVAEALGFVYFDTGAMYRALTALILRRGIRLDDEASVEQCIQAFDFRIVDRNGVKHYFLGQEEITTLIRSQEITRFVSAVSALAIVRKSLLGLQHRFAEGKDVVFEGRDLGTVVFPNAELKVFLTADPAIRAQRRLAELLLKDPASVVGVSQAEMLAQLMERDTLDSSRVVAPLKCPEGALIVDTTRLSIAQVVSNIVDYYRNQED